MMVKDDSYCNNKSTKGGEKVSKSDDDNHANQCNPNNDAYWESRGEDERPDDWKDRVEEDDEE